MCYNPVDKNDRLRKTIRFSVSESLQDQTLFSIITSTVKCKHRTKQFLEVFFLKQKLKNQKWIFFYMFNVFAQNTDCGYTLEPPHNL